MLVGTQPEFQYDALTEMTIEDAASFQNFMEIVSQGEAKEMIEKDEEMFLDRGKLTAVVVEEPVMTGRADGSA